MSQEEWLESLRNRTHNLSNKLMDALHNITVLQQQVNEIEKNLNKLNKLEEKVQKFENQYQILKWILGLVTIIISGITLKLV